MTKAIAIQKAKTISQKYNPDGISPFPFDRVQDDLDDLEIFVVDLQNEKVSGTILYDAEDEVFRILVNDCKPKSRQYFSIAHELGHYFLHRDIILKEEVIVDGDASLDGQAMLFRLDDTASTQMEIEANNFAATLLMPEPLVKRAWEALGDVEECAKIFHVSISAMSIRLESLHLVDMD